MLLLDDMREVMSPALGTLGYELDTTNAQELAEAEALIRSWKENILRFDADSYGQAYANNEVDLVQGYPESIITKISAEQRSNTKFVVPANAMMWVDSFVLVKDAKNRENAHKFVDYIHRPEVYAELMDYLEILSINEAARPLISAESPISYESLSNASMLRAMGDDELAVQSRIWETILSD